VLPPRRPLKVAQGRSRARSSDARNKLVPPDLRRGFVAIEKKTSLERMSVARRRERLALLLSFISPLPSLSLSLSLSPSPLELQLRRAPPRSDRRLVVFFSFPGKYERARRVTTIKSKGHSESAPPRRLFLSLDFPLTEFFPLAQDSVLFPAASRCLESPGVEKKAGSLSLSRFPVPSLTTIHVLLARLTWQSLFLSLSLSLSFLPRNLHALMRMPGQFFPLSL